MDDSDPGRSRGRARVRRGIAPQRPMALGITWHHLARGTTWHIPGSSMCWIRPLRMPRAVLPASHKVQPSVQARHSPRPASVGTSPSIPQASCRPPMNALHVPAVPSAWCLSTTGHPFDKRLLPRQLQLLRLEVGGGKATGNFEGTGLPFTWSIAGQITPIAAEIQNKQWHSKSA